MGSGSAASVPIWSRSSGSAWRWRVGPACSDRLFTEGEQEYAYGQHDPVHSLAARFGAKEAVMKALGAGLGAFAFRDVEVVRDDSGAPSLALHGAAADARRRARRASAGSCRSRTPTRPRWPSCSRWAEARAWSPSSRPTRWARPTGARSPPARPVEVLMDRAGRAVAWEVRRVARGTYGRAGRARLRQGQQRRRRARRRAGARGLGDADPTCSSWPTGSISVAFTRALRRRRRRGRRDVRHRVPRRARRTTPRSSPARSPAWSGPTVVGRHPVGRRRPHAAWSLGPTRARRRAR